MCTIDINSAPIIIVNVTLLSYQIKVKSLRLIISNTLGWAEGVVNNCNTSFVKIYPNKNKCAVDASLRISQAQ